MTIATLEHRGYLLRAYATKIFPTIHDPYATGTKRFTSVVRIENTSPSGGAPRRYAAAFEGANPACSEDALRCALAWGKRIIDGNEDPQQLGTSS